MPNSLVEAQGWEIGPDGNVILTVATNVTPKQRWQECQLRGDFLMRKKVSEIYPLQRLLRITNPALVTNSCSNASQLLTEKLGLGTVTGNSALLARVGDSLRSSDNLMRRLLSGKRRPFWSF